MAPGNWWFARGIKGSTCNRRNRQSGVIMFMSAAICLERNSLIGLSSLILIPYWFSCSQAFLHCWCAPDKMQSESFLLNFSKLCFPLQNFCFKEFYACCLLWSFRNLMRVGIQRSIFRHFYHWLKRELRKERFAYLSCLLYEYLLMTFESEIASTKDVETKACVHYDFPRNINFQLLHFVRKKRKLRQVFER